MTQTAGAGQTAEPTRSPDAVAEPTPEQAPEDSAELADDALAAEIELYADVVVAASECEGPISEGDLDRALGIAGAATVTPARRAAGDPA